MIEAAAEMYEIHPRTLRLGSASFAPHRDHDRPGTLQFLIIRAHFSGPGSPVFNCQISHSLKFTRIVRDQGQA